MIQWIKNKLFQAYAMWWMLRLQRRLLQGEARIWRDVPGLVVGLFAGFNEKLSVDDAPDEARLAWNHFIRSARLEKQRRLLAVQRQVEDELRDAGN